MPKKNINSSLLLVSLLFLPNLVLAAPNISNISGALINNSLITVSGSSFGQKYPVAPLKWDNFENCPVESDMVGGCGYANEGGDGSKAYIKNDKNYSSSGSRSARMDYVSTKTSMFPRIGLNINPGLQELYVSHMGYFTQYSGTGVGTFIFKWTRGGSNPPYDGLPRFYDAVRTDNNLVQTASDRGFVTDKGTTWTQQINSKQNGNKWNRVEYYYKLSAPGVADGVWQQSVNNIYNVNVKNALTRTLNQSNSLIDYAMTPFDGLDSYIGGFYFWIDDYYLDNTQARIEICDSATKAASTHCEVQIPQNIWNDNQLQFKVNQGSFPASSKAYLYVIDKDGNMNTDGHLMNFGSLTDTQPPAASSGLSVQ